MAMLLSDLLGDYPETANKQVSGLTADSRLVKPGFLFAALPGAKADGRQFIDKAISAGACAILTSPEAAVNVRGAITVPHDNPRKHFSELAARFYKDQPANIVAVTGTNGKTSVADFTRQLWTLMGTRAASLGTLGLRSPVRSMDGGLTTPDPVKLHQILAEIEADGVTHVALEASSHGLDQWRLDGVKLKAAAFTNLTRDHLDYHKSEKKYFAAKARLFSELLNPQGTAVVYTGSEWGLALVDICKNRGVGIITVGVHSACDIQLVTQRPHAGGQEITLKSGGETHSFHTTLVGHFQAENIMVAVGLLMATGSQFGDIIPHLPALQGVPGRMEYIGKSASGGAVFVDYAHTPDGLRTVLSAAKDHQPNKLHVVFGCGGDRDQGKRPIMGQIAAEYADHVWVTDDNPRSENAASIRHEIMAACEQAQEVGDRALAISRAIETIKTNDILIIAGKGHEEGQIVGETVFPFSDIATVKALLSGSSMAPREVTK